jgi:hypothetical protein
MTIVVALITANIALLPARADAAPKSDGITGSAQERTMAGQSKGAKSFENCLRRKMKEGLNQRTAAYRCKDPNEW